MEDYRLLAIWVELNRLNAIKEIYLYLNVYKEMYDLGLISLNEYKTKIINTLSKLKEEEPDE